MGVAGMISKLVMTGIIPENSLHLAPVSQKWCQPIFKAFSPQPQFAPLFVPKNQQLDHHEATGCPNLQFAP